MNWTFLAYEALLPLVWAIAATLLGGAAWALHLHRGGGSSRVALLRFLKALALLFPLAFLVSAGWQSRRVLRGLAGVAVGHPPDLRAMGYLRLRGEGFLKADPRRATAWFRRAAERGDAPAQLQLARSLALGRGIPRNFDEARRWAEASARQGDAEAMVLAGDLCRSREDGQALAWYLKAIAALQPGLSRRNPQDCLTYGGMLVTGKGVPKDPVEGLAWMKVAEKGGLWGFQSLLIQLAETKLTQAQREEAARRAQALLSPP
ncbi:MAG: tetratricopeptide repeat protein [Geothrix sp.]|nr:tetratricopeptide repeat protein [Geothrix sp.]